MSIVFYTAPFSSASPVEGALKELAVPHETVKFDLAQNKHKQPEFLKVNPNGKVPAMVVDGQPMFEALAIMQWLGDRYGVERKVWPAVDSPLRLRALSWTTWAYVTYGQWVNRLTYASSEHAPAEMHNPAQAKMARNELQNLLGILDRELSGQPYLLGESFSLADLIVCCVVQYGSHCGVSPAAHPHVSGWLGRCMDRPSLQSSWG
jgi:glutathione S-transferase